MEIHQRYPIVSDSNGKNMKDSFGWYISLSRSSGTSQIADFIYLYPKIIFSSVQLLSRV